MRELSDAARVRELMRALGRAAKGPASVYFTGGATAVLYGWRATTVDVDLRFEPDRDELFHAIVELKKRLRVNIELASPEDFVPVAPDWRERSPFVERQGSLSFHHFDPYAQALAKTERRHAQDVADIEAMVRSGLVERSAMWRYFELVSARLHRYPAIDAVSLERSLDNLFGPRPAT